MTADVGDEATQTCPRCGRVDRADEAFCFCGYVYKPKDRVRAGPLALEYARGAGSASDSCIRATVSIEP